MDRVFKAIDEQYHMKAIGRTVRYVHSGSNNSLKAFFYTNGETYESKTINFEIVDRVGLVIHCYLYSIKKLAYVDVDV